MPARYVCDRCHAAFEADEARCPRCLRKSSVRAEGSAGSLEVERLASGRAIEGGGARAGALIAAIALSAALGAPVLAGWAWLARHAVAIPVLAGWIVASAALVRAGLVGGSPRAFVARVAWALGLGGWALVAGTVAVVAGAELSPVFTAALGIVLFGGGLIGMSRWMQAREEPAAPASGKWR